MESNSRETSPDLGKKKSRRKPTVTRKITDEADKIDPDADTSFDYLQAVEENNKEKKEDEEEHLINGDSNDVDPVETSPPKNGHNKEDFIIPEGTVIVEPEAVEETKKEEYKGPEWKATRRLSRSAALGIIQCTACNKQINTNNTGAAKRHPVLKVLICKRCYSWYASAEIEQDSDGMDEQCRWCGDGGNLICCDYCHNAFCKSCIKKNLGRKELSDIVAADDKAKWHCYVCDPKPLANLIADCTLVLQNIDKEQKVDDKKKDKKDTVHTGSKSKPAQTQQHNRVTKQSQVAKKSTTPNKHTSVGPENKINQRKPNSAMTVTTPSGKVVLPPGAIPVKTVINKAGNQVIVLQQPNASNQGTNVANKGGSQTKANSSQMQIISNAVKNVSMVMNKGKPPIVVQKSRQEVKTVKPQVVRYEWDAPINEYNVGQALDRTLAVTESLRMVMVSLKDDMKKANSYPVQQCLEKKRIVAAKIRRAMGAFKKQVLDIEHFCKTTAKVAPKSQKTWPSKHEKPGSQPQKNKQPFPVSLLKHKSPPTDSKPSGKSKKDVEIIELSDSSDDESSPKQNNKKKDKEGSPTKDKKNFQLKLQLGGSAYSLGNNKRKRRHSSDENASDEGSEKENENKEGDSPKEDKKIPEKRQKKSGDGSESPMDSDDEPLLQSQISKKKTDNKNSGSDNDEKSEKNTDVVKDSSEKSTESVKDSSETKTEENVDNIGDSESDSEVKEEMKENKPEDKGDKSGSGEEEAEEVKAESEAEAMETEEKGEGHTVSKSDEEEEGMKQEVTSSEGNIKKKEVACSESESDSEVKESQGSQSDQEISNQPGEEEVEEMEADSHEVNSNKENNENDDEEDNEEDLKQDVEEEPAMDADSSELRDSKISSDGEKLEFQQLDGAKDTKKSKRKKAGAEEDEKEADTSFDINGKAKGEVRRLPTRSGTRSRSDIEAQRQLHRELLEDDSEEGENEEGNQEDGEQQDDLSLDSSSDESSSPDLSSDLDYMPNAENRGGGDKDSRKKTAEKQSKRDKEKGGSTKKSMKFGEKREKSKRGRKKLSSKKKSTEENSDESDSELVEKEKTSTKKNKMNSRSKSSKKSSSSQKSSTHSKNRKKSKNNTEDSDSEDDKPLPKRNGKQRNKEDSSRKKVKGKPVENEKEKEEGDSSQENSHNSTDYDSELEKDIEKLARVPQVTAKKSKKKETVNSDNEDEKDEKETKKKFGDKKEKPVPLKKGAKARMEELSSGEELSMDEQDEVDEEEDMAAAGARAMAELEAGLDYPSEDDEEVDEDVARQALLADDSPVSSDSDVDEMLAEKSESKKSSSKTKPGGEGTAGSEDEAESQEDADNQEDADSQEDAESQDGESQDEGKSKKSSAKKSKFNKNKLLDAALSDSEEDFEIKPSKKKKRDAGSSSDEDMEEDNDDKGVLTDVSSDFDITPKKKVAKKKKKKSSSESEDNSDSDDSDAKGKKGKGKKGKRKRIKVATDSDDEAKSEGSGDSDEEGKHSKRKKIRKLIKDKKLSVDTISAAKAEEERRKRIQDRQKRYNQIDEEDVNSPTKSKITTKLVLEMDEKTKKPLIEVNSGLIRKLKPHQVEAVRFMWDCCIESIERIQKEEGAGCILAHCMGLGKTLSVITFIHTLMQNAELTGINTCLIVCPLNTVLNWQRELGYWLEEEDQLLVDELTSVKDNYSRCDLLEQWQKSGGCMIMGYEMYRNLSTLRNIKKAKMKKIITSSLVDPGPDIVVCDEGHILKNDASALSKAMSNIRTRKRIALTGTPLQNNLVEYHCMVDFVKPKLLGTRKEFMNRFVNPIKNGQCSDSSDHDVKLMKKRAHILHEKLAGCVQRKDYSALTKFLPPKHEYVICVRLSEVQIELYEKYLRRQGCVVVEGEKIKGAKLFSDYHALMRIWTHPWVLKLQEIRDEMKKMYETDEDSFIDDTDEDSFIDDSSQNSPSSSEEQSVQEVSSDSDTGRRKGRRRGTRGGKDEDKGQINGKKSGEVVKSWKTKSRGGGDTDSVKTTASTESEKPQLENGGEDPVSGEWWAEHVSEEDKYNLEISGKIMLLGEVLKLSENIGDKVLVFSQSLLSLDLIEDFLDHWDTDNNESQTGGTMGWTKGLDYFRMDGSTSAINRTGYANVFNDPENVRSRLFLISTKAGSLGTNLVGANRVIIFDASWNPSHDTQSIFRVYRFGQTKPVYIYRFLAQGTMEEKIYERQVTKQSLSQRVVDEHQVERHFTNADLSELYNFKPEVFKEDTDYLPVLPKDKMLAELLTEKKRWIVKYHEHDSLLENKIEEDLTEEERKAAWEEFELEKKHGFRPAVRPMVQATGQMYNYNNVNTQYARGATSFHVPPPQFSVKEIEELAKAIYAANPGINQVELQMRVQQYVARQQQMYQQRQREQMMHEMARLRHLQDERVRQEQALKAAYTNSQTPQTQGTSAGISSASSLLRTLVSTGTGQATIASKDDTNEIVEVTEKKT